MLGSGARITGDEAAESGDLEYFLSRHLPRRYVKRAVKDYDLRSMPSYEFDNAAFLDAVPSRQIMPGINWKAVTVEVALLFAAAEGIQAFMRRQPYVSVAAPSALVVAGFYALAQGQRSVLAKMEEFYRTVMPFTILSDELKNNASYRISPAPEHAQGLALLDEGSFFVCKASVEARELMYHTHRCASGITICEQISFPFTETRLKEVLTELAPIQHRGALFEVAKQLVDKTGRAVIDPELNCGTDNWDFAPGNSRSAGGCLAACALRVKLPICA